MNTAGTARASRVDAVRVTPIHLYNRHSELQ